MSDSKKINILRFALNMPEPPTSQPPMNHESKRLFWSSGPSSLDVTMNFISIYKKRSSFQTRKKDPWYLTVVILWYAVAMSPCLACFLLNKKSKRCVVSWHAMSYEWPTTKSSSMLVNSKHIPGWHATYATSTTWRKQIRRHGDTKQTLASICQTRIQATKKS